MFYVFTGKLSTAKECFNKVLVICKNANDRRYEGTHSCNLRNAHVCRCHFKEALEYFSRHLSIAKELKSREGEACTYCAFRSARSVLATLWAIITFSPSKLIRRSTAPPWLSQVIRYFVLTNTNLFIYLFIHGFMNKTPSSRTSLLRR